jgi:DNA polymerase-3 subunit beta
MIITTMREKLLPIISIVEKIVGRKESLPVLSCIVLDIGKEIIVKATNLESGVEARIPGEIKEKGVVAIPATIFSQTLKSIHSDIINLSLEGGNLLIESKGSKTLIKSTPHAEFPNLSVVDIKNGVQYLDMHYCLHFNQFHTRHHLQ